MKPNQFLLPYPLRRVIGGLRERIYRHIGIPVRTLLRHAETCRKMDTDYVWGGMGQLITPELIEKKRAEYPAQYDGQTCRRLMARCGHKVYGFDCSGLIKTCLMGGLRCFRYDPARDLSAAMMLERSPLKGPIDTLPERPGLCLFMEGHVGIYIGNGRVIEATANPNFGYGVVETRVSDRTWLYWFECPFIRYRRMTALRAAKWLAAGFVGLVGAIVLAIPMGLSWFSARKLVRRYPMARFYTLRREQADFVPLDKISPHVVRLTPKLEDYLFYTHPGYDIGAIYGAFRRDLQERSFAAGGSTVTQQLVKNLYLPFRKTLRRKMTELFLALRMERTLTKDQILELYLNTVSFGGDLWGIGAASHYYFGKPAAQLSENQALLLLTLLPSPQGFNPLFHPERYVAARERNLRDLVSSGSLTEEQADAIRAANPVERPDPELIFRPADQIPPTPKDCNHCAAALRRQMDAQ